MTRTRLAVLILLLIASAACNGAQGQGTGRDRGRNGAAIAVSTTRLERVAIDRRVDLSGTLVSPDQAKVSAEVAGIVREVPIELGTEVRAGAPLVRLEPRELALALERADSALRQVEAQLGVTRRQAPPLEDDQIASIRQARANRDDAKAAFDRAAQLNGRGLVSKVDMDAADTRLKVTEANYDAALDNIRVLRATLQDRRASYELAIKKLDDAVIKAPVSGSISERLVQPGEFIRENTQVATIVQINPLKLRTSIQEKFASAIRKDQTVRFTVEAFPDRQFDGKVAFISPAIEQSTRTFAIEILVNNNERLLRPGFFAKGNVTLRVDSNVLAVDDAAVSTFAGVSTVYVVEGGKARQQIVTLGDHTASKWEVLGGLKGNETLATSQLNQLATGVAVVVSGEDGAEDGGRNTAPAAERGQKAVRP